VASRRPDAALVALEHLGWGEGYAQTSPCPGVDAFERLLLGSYPTRAAVAREQRAVAVALDNMAYFAGNRWSLAVHEGALRWHDFSAGKIWHCGAGGLTGEALQGFTPESFVRIGRFEPLSGALEDAARSEDASEYLLGRIQMWWKRWLRDLAPSADVEAERDHFVQLLSALLLVKTLEDLDRLPWLRRGTLLGAARDGAALPRLLHRSAKALNSRVLRSVAELPEDSGLVRPLLEAIEESEIDFASLDVDPVGAFYERMLGTSHQVADAVQPTLPSMGHGREVIDDTSARRRLGAFFTPRSYADTLAHQLILPAARIAETAQELPAVLDPAAGSGELLCAALREMFTDATWRRPEAVRLVLAEKLWAIDRNRHAVHLAALNVLRTAVRLVPEMLDDATPFPALDRNFIVGDATTRSVLDRVPTVDAVLLNPPFKGHRQWQVPAVDRAAPLDALPGPVNLAFAFLTIAINKVRDGGAVGAVMASQLFSGVQHRAVREQIGATLCVETVVVNYGSPFPDALSYAGLLMGHRLPGCQLPRAEVITVPAGTRGAAADFGAALFVARDADTNAGEARATTRWLSIAAEAAGDWTVVSPPPTRRDTRRSPRMALEQALIGGIHQGVVVAPMPWKYGLFVFDDVPGGVVHRGGRDRLDDRTSALRMFARPNLMSLVPNLCEPSVPHSRVFLPGDGSPKGVALDELRVHDPVAAKLAEAIVARVQATPGTESALARAFSQELSRGRIKYNRSKGFVDGAEPQLILAQASRSEPGREKGVVWSVWVNMDGSVVPLEGIHARPASLEQAIVISVCLNVRAAIDPFLSLAPARNMGTRKPLLSALAKWMIPDLSVGVYQHIVGELVDAFHLYRDSARARTPDEAHASKEYRDVIDLGEKLWRL